MVQDVYQALKEVGFDNYNIQLEEFMKNYNQDKEDKRENKNIQSSKSTKQGIKRSMNLLEEIPNNKQGDDV